MLFERFRGDIAFQLLRFGGWPQTHTAACRFTWGQQASWLCGNRTPKGRKPPRGKAAFTGEEECASGDPVGWVRPDRRVRQLPLHANDVETVPLEVVRGRFAVAERLALRHEPAKLL